MRAFLRRHLPRPVLAFARSARARLRTRAGDYRHRIAAEAATFAGQAEVHDLPPIFHYWSNRYLRPMLEPFGFDHPDAFFHRYAAAAYDSAAEGPRRFASIGAGNCDTEVRLAVALSAGGRTDFTIECVELNAAMLKRGAEAAQTAGVGAHIVLVEQDFNRWRPRGPYNAVLASHSLHHVVALEALFDAIHRALARDGLFVTTDIIGRNGHVRWPEARRIVDEFWEELPRGYRFNRQLRRQENRFEDWDCSVGSFEGIRAQDILPLLVERFHFDLFVGFANVIDPFTDRSFGPNFDAGAQWDRAFIDRVHAKDEAELSSGRIKPTHMFAVLQRERGRECLHLPGRSARESIRWPDSKRQ
jgi:SAM-dependent methyltransferase